jgi:hypothetical protein
LPQTTQINVGGSNGEKNGGGAAGPKKEITKKKKAKRSFNSKIKKMNAAINKAVIDVNDSVFVFFHFL